MLSGEVLHGQPSDPDKHYKFPLKSILSYCPSDTLTVVRSEVLEYDNNHRLTRVSWLNGPYEYRRREFTYDEFGMRISVKTSLLGAGLHTTTCTYDYNSRKQLAWMYCEDETGKKETYQYQYNPYGQLVSWEENFNGKTVTNRLEYDEKHRLIKKHHRNSTVLYEYQNDRLVRRYADGSDWEVRYAYDVTGRLTEKSEKDGSRELYTYRDGVLVRTRIYFDGGDPCFEIPCCSEYVIHYVYHSTGQ